MKRRRLVSLFAAGLVGRGARLQAGPRRATSRCHRPDASWRSAGRRPKPPRGGMVTYDALTVDVDRHRRRAGDQLGAVPRAESTGQRQRREQRLPDDPRRHHDAGRRPSPPRCRANACTLFGPETPPPMKGQPPMRPADPDTTGGFYQPVRATWQSDAGPAAVVRARADHLPARQRADRHRRDSTPPTTSPTTTRRWPIWCSTRPARRRRSTLAGQTAAPHAATVSAGQKVTLQADFSADSAETFLVWNVLTLTLDMQRESLRLSWFATGGAFEHDATGRSQTETETFTQNVWTAPIDAGPGLLLDGAARQPRRHRLRRGRNRRDAMNDGAPRKRASFRRVFAAVTGSSPGSSTVAGE